MATKVEATKNMSSRTFKKQLAEISLRDEFLISPWRKFRKYGSPPWKALLHFVIVIFAIVQGVLLYKITENETRGTQTALNAYFLPLTPTDEGSFYTGEQIVEAMNITRAKYYSFVKASVTEFKYVRTDSGEIAPIELVLHPRTGPKQEYGIFENDTEIIGPFDLNKPLKLQAIFHNTPRMSTTFKLINVKENLVRTVIIEYSNGAGGLIRPTVVRREVERHRKDTRSDLYYEFLIINVILVLLCALALALHVRVLIRNIRFYRLVAAEFNKIPKERLKLYTRHTKIPISVVIDFVKTWLVLFILGTIFMIIACSRCIYDYYMFQVSWTFQAAEALGVFLVCSSLIRYGEFQENFYIMVNTLAFAFRGVLRGVLTFAFVFTGYAVIGTLFFGGYAEQFATFSETSMTLFAVLNGDEIIATMTALNADVEYVWLAELYMYSFVGLFLLFTMKIFIQLIRDGYLLSRKLGNDSAHSADAIHFREDFAFLLELVDNFLQNEAGDAQLFDMTMHMSPPERAFETVLRQQELWMRDTQNSVMELNSQYMAQLANQLTELKRRRSEAVASL